MKRSFALTAIMHFSIGLLSQPMIQWQRTIGGNWYDELVTIQQTSDSGYVAGGVSVSDSSGDKSENKIGYQDFWIVKLNNAGVIQWENTIGGDSIDAFTTLQQTSDGGYILGGYSRSGISGDKTSGCIGDHDYWLVKLNAAGVVVWDKTIGGSAEDILKSVKQSTDGGYILAGYSASDSSGNKSENSKGAHDFWVVKLDSLGSIIWQKTIGGSGGDKLECVNQNYDNGYYLGGYSNSNISGDKTEICRGAMDYWILKIDSSGNIVWQKTFGGGNDDYLLFLVTTKDGGCIVNGTTNSNISGDKAEDNCNLSDYWIVKFDSAGNVQWQNTIGSFGDDYGYAIGQTINGYIVGGTCDNGGLIICDKTELNKGGTDYWILHLDTIGNIQWQKTLGGSITNALYSAAQTIDGGYILGGESNSDISGDKSEDSKGVMDYWIIKLSNPVGIVENLDNSSFFIYPNPVENELNIQSSKYRMEKIELYNSFGEKLIEKINDQVHMEEKVNLSIYANGIYFIRIITSSGIASMKAVKINKTF